MDLRKSVLFLATYYRCAYIYYSLLWPQTACLKRTSFTHLAWIDASRSKLWRSKAFRTQACDHGHYTRDSICWHPVSFPPTVRVWDYARLFMSARPLHRNPYWAVAPTSGVFASMLSALTGIRARDMIMKTAWRSSARTPESDIYMSIHQSSQV